MEMKEYTKKVLFVFTRVNKCYLLKYRNISFPSRPDFCLSIINNNPFQTITVRFKTYTFKLAFLSCVHQSLGGGTTGLGGHVR